MYQWLALSERSNNEQIKTAVTVLTRISIGKGKWEASGW
jgi:hypothetical protein